MKERDLYLASKKISSVDIPDIVRPVRGQTDTKAKIIDLFLKKSIGLNVVPLVNSDITASTEFAAALISDFVRNYRNNPMQAAEYFMAALLESLEDTSWTEHYHDHFLDTALDEYVDLIVRLDRLAFPPLDIVYQGIPEYLPDGLSDMGHSPSSDPLKRSREKIRINKVDVYRDHKDFIVTLMKFFQNNHLHPNTEAWEKVAFFKVLEYVYDQMPYDHTYGAAIPKDRSVSLIEFGKNKQKALCRHQALLVQVLLQLVAVSSRLYRCDVLNVTESRGGRHVANLARIGSQWYLGDATSPEADLFDVERIVPFIRPVPATADEIPDNMEFTATITVNNLAKQIQVRYTTLNHMFYRIRDNHKDLIK